MWLVLLLYASTVRAQQCSDAVLFQPWDDAWLVRYNKWPCTPNSPWAAFCEDSGWGDEEATVVCREHGYSHGTSDFLPAYTSAIGYSHIECEGTESALEQCSIGDPSLFCSFVGVVTRCHTGPDVAPEVAPSTSLMVSEGDSAHFCVSLRGTVRETVQILIETEDENAVANYDYIPVSYTLTFGPSLQSEQCRDIQTINDSLAEGLEMFTVQLITNSSAVELTTPQIMINIQHNDAQSDSCEDGSLTVVSDVNESSLQLVEMCSEGVWSPVCDHNWTVADATVVCRELGMAQDEVIVDVLPSQGLSHEAHSIVCEGSEATLADCFVKQGTVTTCHYLLVQCGDVANSQAGGSSAGAVAGVVIAVLVVVVVVMVVAVLSVIWWKTNVKSHDDSATTMGPSHHEFAEGFTRPVRGQQQSLPQSAAERKEDSIEDFELTDNPVYAVGAHQPVERRDGSVENFKLTDNPVYGVCIDQPAL